MVYTLLDPEQFVLRLGSRKLNNSEKVLNLLKEIGVNKSLTFVIQDAKCFCCTF